MDAKNRYKILKLTMFNSGPGGYPMLKGKAMEVRGLAPALCALWRQGMTAGDVFHVAIAEALTSCCRMDDILTTYRKRVKLPELIGRQFTAETFKYIQQQLIVHNYQGLRLFNITYKHHALAHCGIRAQQISPRVSWCYVGEDWMKLVRQIGAPCTRGMPMLQVHKTALIKFMRAIEYTYDNM